MNRVKVLQDLCSDTKLIMIDAIKKALASEFLTIEKTENIELIKTRMSICEGCPSFDKEKKKCLECGCFMEIKTTLLKHRNPKKKGRVEITHCPLGKWGDKEIANKYRIEDNKEILK